MTPYTLFPDMNGEGLHIGVVRARFNEDIGMAELDALPNSQNWVSMNATSWLSLYPALLSLA